jgi:hypothetical protein
MRMRSVTLLLLLLLGVVSTAEAEPMSFKIHAGSTDCAGCVIVAADGEITEATPALFRRFTEEHQLSFPKVMTLVMNSPGGSLMGGLALGELIRSRGFNTHVERAVNGPDGKVAFADGICASACAYAFLGGSRRSVGLRGKYGLHQISSSSGQSVALRDAVGSTQDVIASISKYVEKMGASQEVVTLATQTRSEDILWVDGSRLSYLRIVNSSGLNTQEAWISLGLPTHWAVWSTASDGSRLIFSISCDRVVNRGYTSLSVTHYRPLPNGHPYNRRGYDIFPVHIHLDGESVATFEETVRFDAISQRVSVKLRIWVFFRALRSGGKLSMRVDYPPELADAAAMRGYDLPVEGLSTALSTMWRHCPDL